MWFTVWEAPTQESAHLMVHILQAKYRHRNVDTARIRAVGTKVEARRGTDRWTKRLEAEAAKLHEKIME